MREELFTALPRPCGLVVIKTRRGVGRDDGGFVSCIVVPGPGIFSSTGPSATVRTVWVFILHESDYA